MLQTIIKFAWFGIILLFILFGVLFGAKRGLRKTLFRGIWLLLGALVLFIIVGPISDGILGLKSSLFGVGEAGQTLKDYITNLICSESGIENTAENAETIASLLQLVSLLLNSIIFMILFVLFRFIFLPLNAMFYNLFFKSKAEKQYKQDLKQYKIDIKNYKKNSKNFKKIEAMGFADGEKPEFEENLQKIEEPTSTPINTTSHETMAINETPAEAVLNVEEQQSEVTPQTPANSEENKQITTLPSKDLRPVVTKPVKPKKPNKRRWWGCLAGLAVGLFISSMSLVPINGIMQMANEINKEPATLIDESNTTDGLLTALLKQQLDKNPSTVLETTINGEFVEWVINEYNDGLGGKVYTYTGARPLSNVTFNQLSSTTINGTRIYLKDDVVNIVKVASLAKSFQDKFDETQKGYTVSNLNSLLQTSKQLLNDALSLQIVKGVGSVALPLVQDFANNYIDNSNLEDKEMFKMLIKSVIDGVSNDTNAIDTIKSDLLEVIDVAISLNAPIENHEEKSILSILLSNNIEEDKVIFAKQLGKNHSTISSLFGNTLNTKIISSALPYGVYYLTNYLSKSYNFSLGEAITYEDFVALENLQQTLIDIVDEGLTILGELDLDNLSYTGLNKTIFVCLGKILDNVKDGLMPEKTYTNLISTMQSKVSEMLPDLNFNGIDLNDGFKGEDGVIKNISNISSWETEFTKIGSAYDELFNGSNPIIPLVDGKPDTKSIDWARIGQKLDILQTTTLLGSNDETKPSKLNTILLEAMQSYLDKEISKFPNITDQTKQDKALINIYSYLKNTITPRLNNVNFSWENEFKGLSGTVSFLVNNIDKFGDMFNNEEGKSIFVQLGENLDTINGTTLLTKNDIKEILPDLIDYAGDLGSADYITKAVNDIKINIKNAKELSFGKEFNHIETLINNFSDSNFDDISGLATNLGSALDSITNEVNHSDIITNQIFIDLLTSVLNDYKENLSGNLSTGISNLITSITGTETVEGTLNNNNASSIIGTFDSNGHLSKDGIEYKLLDNDNCLKVNGDCATFENNYVTINDVTYELVIEKTETSTTKTLRIIKQFFEIGKFAGSNKVTFGNENYTLSLDGTTPSKLLFESDEKTYNLTTKPEGKEAIIYGKTYRFNDVNGQTIISLVDGEKIQIIGGFVNNLFVYDDIKFIYVDENSVKANKFELSEFTKADDNKFTIRLNDFDCILIANNSTFTLLKEYKFWCNELEKISTLVDLTEVDLGDLGNLKVVGKTLDNVLLDNSFKSRLITNAQITNLIIDTLESLTPDIISGLDSSNQNIITNLIGSKSDNIDDSIIGNLTGVVNGDIKIDSWEYELDLIYKLTNIKDFEASGLVTIGRTLDSIAYNYDNTPNSKIITKKVLDEMIGSALSLFKLDNTTIINNAINNTITNISSNINGLNLKSDIDYKNHNFKWENELGKLESLKNIEINDTNYKNSGVLTSLGSTLDGIAFNDNEANNSWIITKANINELIADILEIAKTSGESNFNTTLNKIISRIDNLETSNYYSKENYKWQNEFAFFEMLLNINFEDSNMSTLLGNLKQTNKGLYFNNQSVLTNNSAPIYGNEQNGAGVTLDNIINSEDNSVLIISDIINELLLNTIEDNSSSLSGSYGNILTNIKNRLDPTKSDYKQITSYASELQSINYLLDMTKVYTDVDTNLETTELTKIGSYLDDIHSSVLVGDSGKNIISNVMDLYTAPSELNDVNSCIDNKKLSVYGISDAQTDILGMIKSNIENYEYNETSNNYERLFTAVGDMKDEFNTLLNGLISFDFSATALVSEENRKAIKEKVYAISYGLENLQSNFIVGSVATRYLTIYILEQLDGSIKDIKNPITGETAYPEGFDKTYVSDSGESTMDLDEYFVINNRLDSEETETYFNLDWYNKADGTYSSDLENYLIPESHENNDNGEFNYGLIRIVNSYIACTPTA